IRIDRECNRPSFSTSSAFACLFLGVQPCYHAATGIGEAIPIHQEDGSSDSSVFLGLALHGVCEAALNRVCKPQVGQAVLPTARVQRGESATARCASTGDQQVTLLSPFCSFLICQML